MTKKKKKWEPDRTKGGRKKKIPWSPHVPRIEEDKVLNFGKVHIGFIKRMKKLTGGAVKVYLCLCSHARYHIDDPFYGKCFVGFERIAKDTGLNTRRIPLWIDELEKLKLVKRSFQRFQNDSGAMVTVNVFELLYYTKEKEEYE